MRINATKVLRAILLASAIAMLATTCAQASRGQLSVVDDSNRLLSHDPAQQDAGLDEISSLGAEIVKFPILWREVAPAVNTGGLSDPNAYPVGAWDRFDRLYNGAQARGMKVWIMINAPAPLWAVEKEVSDFPGTYKPNPTLLGEFAEAVGKRYPNAAFISVWNEVNIATFLQPQTVGGVAQSAIQYRSMYRSAYDGLIRAGRSGSTILFGELLPRIRPNEYRRKVAPLKFLRDFFCIDEKGRKVTGSAAKKLKCSGFQPIKTGGLAYHPYTMAGGPLVKEPFADNATIYYLKRVERVLDQASKQKRLAARKLPIYSSEFGLQSDPPDPYMTVIRKIPAYLNLSEYLHYKDSRVKTYSQYLLIDDADVGAFQTGLRFVDGTKKPGVYEAYQLPFDVFKYRGDTVTVWGAARAATSAQNVDLQVKSGSSWTTVQTIAVQPPLGYFERRITVPGANSKTFRLLWNGITSRTTKPGKPVKAATN